MELLGGSIIDFSKTYEKKRMSQMIRLKRTDIKYGRKDKIFDLLALVIVIKDFQI